MLVLVTGASSGFGFAISQLLVEKGYHVIGISRREVALGENFYSLQADLTQFDDVKHKLQNLPAPFLIQNIDVLINNAGLALGLEPAYQAKLADWHTMINTNITALVNLTHFILPFMTQNKSGTILNLGSTAGSYAYAGGNVYGATKAFVSQFSDNLRTDLVGLNIRVCNIEPGLCSDTEFSNVRFKGDDQKAKAVYNDVQAITPQDVAHTLDWLIHLPQHVNINHLEMMPTCQNSAGLQVTKKHIK